MHTIRNANNMQARQAFLLFGCILAASLIGSVQGAAKYNTFGDALSQTPGYSIMNKLARMRSFSGLLDLNSNSQMYTVFAPSDVAFRKLAATLKVSESALYNPIFSGIIKSVIKAHIVPGRYGTTMLNKGMTLSTQLSGKTLYTKDGYVTSAIGVKAKIIFSAYAGKGIFHGCDNVLLPYNLPALG